MAVGHKDKTVGQSYTPDLDIEFKQSRFDKEEILEHYHGTCEIAYFKKADIRIFIKDVNYEIRDGDILFIDEYDIHRIIYSSHTQYERYVVNFKKEYVAGVLRALELDSLMDVLNKKENKKVNLNLKQRDEIENLLMFLAEACKRNTGADETIVRAEGKTLLAAAIIKYYELMMSNGVNEKENRKKKDTQVKDIIGFIDSGYMSEISLDLLSDKFYLSKFYISRIFKEITGFSVMEYIQHRRVVEVRKLLATSGKGIAEICYECGFNSIQHFYLVFKKITGTTPHQYRKI